LVFEIYYFLGILRTMRLL